MPFEDLPRKKIFTLETWILADPPKAYQNYGKAGRKPPVFRQVFLNSEMVWRNSVAVYWGYSGAV